MRPRSRAGLEERPRRLTLIAGEVARIAGGVLAEYGAGADEAEGRAAAEGGRPTTSRAARAARAEALSARRPWSQLAHLPRYLKAIVLRLDKLRPIRRAMRHGWPSCGRSSSATCASSRSGAAPPTPASTSSAGGSRSCASSLFAQELKTPQPVSVKRLEKIWAQAFA